MPRSFPRLMIRLVILGLALLPFANRARTDEENPPLDDDFSPRFVHSSTCALCHSSSPRASAMRTASGESVAPHDLWRASPMANSARDPIFRAVLSAEIAAAPARRESIERQCLGCHTPMASRMLLARGESPSVAGLLGDGPTDPVLHALALDGVACSTCHRMTAEGLGDEASFDGRWRVARDDRLFGPHARPFAMPMRHHTGFEPTESQHILESALCGSCHTLSTEALDADGEPTGHRVVEQAPYLEWRNSTFSTERDPRSRDAASCQDCHAPTVDDSGQPIITRIARNPGGGDFPPTQPRSPFGQHSFLGGNTVLPALLRDHATELRVEAPRDAFDRWISAAKKQLSRRTARLELAAWTHADGELRLDLHVENLTGHKLPTGYPARRLWLEVLVRDRDGRTLLHSGAHDTRGRLVDATGVVLPSELAGGPLARHRDRVTSSDEVATWESTLATSEGQPTYRLLRGATYAKDDRLLPRGWSDDPEKTRGISPEGVLDDPDFLPGEDTVHYSVSVAKDRGPWRLQAILHYQPLAPRFLDELSRFETDEVRRLERLLASADLEPEVVDQLLETLPPDR